MSLSWPNAAKALRKFVRDDAAKPREEQRLDDGQRALLEWIGERLPHSSGLVLADEVGSGKTRVACAVVHAVPGGRTCGGRRAARTHAPVEC